MKTMTCKQLGGACDVEFSAETFEEIAEQSRKHGMRMYQEGDLPHIKAMQAMQELMHNPSDMQSWMEKKRMEFNSL